MLPILAAVLLATSCSKDGDSNVVNNPVPIVTPINVNPDATSETFTITVVKGGSLSKATVADDGTNLTQQFIDGDVLVISGNGLSTTIETILTLQSTNEDKTEVVFSGLIHYAGSKNASNLTTLNAVLRNTSSEHPNSGTALAANEIHQVASLAEGFEKYGYLTATDFEYKGNETSITLIQNTAFLEILVPETVKSVNVNRHIYPVSVGKCYFAVANGTEIVSNLLKSARTVSVADGKVVKTINRMSGVDALPGIFSVGEGKQVFFSKGNLQYQVGSSPAAWRFAEHQYDICHKDGDNVGFDYSDWIGKWTDLFGWVGESSDFEGVAMYGVSTSSNNGDYGTSKTESLKAGDWGNVFGEGSPWHTLTCDHTATDARYYLFNRRTNASDKYGVANVCGVQGLIILPDEWTLPEGCTFTNGESIGDGADYYETINSIDADKWVLMEANGAVFLPAAGCRNGTDVDDVGDNGRFWSSSPFGGNTADSAWSIYFNSGYVSLRGFDNRTFGLSVRLVRPL